jgi:hypothetical protein
MKYLGSETIDAITLATGFLAVVAKLIWRYLSGRRPIFIVQMMTVDFLNGSVIFPFVLLISSVFSSEIRGLLLQTSPLSLALAGGIGLMFVLEELIRRRKY